MKSSVRFGRKILTLLVLVTLVLLVSACSDRDDSSELKTQKVTEFAGGWPYATVPTGHFNMFVANAIELKFYRELHQLPLATYKASSDEYMPMLAESWELSDDNQQINIKLRDDATWQTGEKFTSQDVWTTFMTYKLVGNPVWNYIENVEVINDTEVSFSIKEETTMIYRYILRKPIVDYKTYGTYADQVNELLNEGKDETSEEWKALVGEFNNFRPDVVNATGPYYLDPSNVSQSHVELIKNDKSFLADTVNFEKVLVYNGDVPDLTPLVLNKRIDYLTHQFPPASMETFKNAGYGTIELQGVDGLAVYFNSAKKPLDQVEVRQAIAHVIDRASVGELALPGITKGTEYVTGLGDLMTETWVDTSKLIDYSVDFDKATELLQSAGLTKTNGKWVLEDGTSLKLTIQAPSTWTDAATAAMEVAQQLTAFGIETSFDGIDALVRQTNINDGNFDLALSFFGTGQPHPFFAYETPLLMSNLNAPKGMGYSMTQQTESVGHVDLAELLNQSTQGWDDEKQKMVVEKIAYTVNETVPYLPIYSKWAQNISSEGLRTDWGSDEDLYLNSAGDDNFAVIKILTGELKPIE
ncbi:ABC transporter substrate-binding protein [Psychrobacillus antarcticus]|uniref:ABC transporter substrate-binding protein n=1 Tax=Psychrobacillus antarcticus TaxID=2879115 RepID=UPI0024080389|nr:ABC transporter substrate-binding protein [Psychrobacillus antarcticus]